MQKLDDNINEIWKYYFAKVLAESDNEFDRTGQTHSKNNIPLYN